MAKTKNPPCIRNLERFKKSGCPQCLWDGENGCPAWVEMITSDPDNPLKQRTEKKCIDLWVFQFSWAQLGLLEGNQQAIESFRNNMSVEGAPRPDPAMARLVRALETHRQQIAAHGHLLPAGGIIPGRELP